MVTESTNNATIKGYISDGTASATAGDATITFIGVSVALFAQADIFVQGGYSPGVIFGIDADACCVTLQQLARSADIRARLSPTMVVLITQSAPSSPRKPATSHDGGAAGLPALHRQHDADRR